MSEPTTAAGRALLHDIPQNAVVDINYWRSRILAIEAEARAAALDEARAAVEKVAAERMPGRPASQLRGFFIGGYNEAKHDALAAIDALREDADKT